MSLTDFSPAASRFSTRRRCGSATALKASAVVGVRAMPSWYSYIGIRQARLDHGWSRDGAGVAQDRARGRRAGALEAGEALFSLWAAPLPSDAFDQQPTP